LFFSVWHPSPFSPSFCYPFFFFLKAYVSPILPLTNLSYFNRFLKRFFLSQGPVSLPQYRTIPTDFGELPATFPLTEKLPLLPRPFRFFALPPPFEHIVFPIGYLSPGSFQNFLCSCLLKGLIGPKKASCSKRVLESAKFFFVGFSRFIFCFVLGPTHFCLRHTFPLSPPRVRLFFFFPTRTCPPPSNSPARSFERRDSQVRSPTSRTICFLSSPKTFRPHSSALGPPLRVVPRLPFSWFSLLVSNVLSPRKEDFYGRVVFFFHSDLIEVLDLTDLFSDVGDLQGFFFFRVSSAHRCQSRSSQFPPAALFFRFSSSG